MKGSFLNNFSFIPKKLGKKHITISFAVHSIEMPQLKRTLQKFKSEACNKSKVFFMTESVQIPPK